MLIFRQLRYWIWGGYCIPILLMLASATVVTVNVDRVRSEAEALNDSREIAEYLADVAVDVQIMSKTTRGYLIEKNPTSLQSFNGAKENYRKVIALVDPLVRDERQDDNLERLEQKVNALIEFDEGLIRLVDAGKAGQALQRWQEGGAVQLAEEIADLLAQVRTREQEIVDGRRAAQSQALDNLVWVVWGSIGVAIAVSVGLGAWIIATIVQKITREATNITRATMEISTTVEQQERVAVQQATSVNQTTTSMDELGASSTAATEQADAALTGAKQALSLSETGQQAVDSTLEGMGTLQDKVEAIARQIVRLSEQTNQIGNISQLVADLANQTNMLALNAAVEAVRAGEHGRGFGVVATEIRKLADESQKSAQKIGTLVADIQAAINSTVMVTEEGTKTVRSGVDLAQKTAGAFSGVTEAVNEVVMNNQQISLNIKQQALAIAQVLEAMEALKQGANETANGIGQTKNGMQQLKGIAAELQSII